MGKITIHYTDKNYRFAPSLNKASDLIGRFTHPGLVFLLTMILMAPFVDTSSSNGNDLLFIGIVAVPQLIAPLIRMLLFKMLDNTYKKMLEGKIPLE